MVRITNVVATAQLGCELDLDLLEKKLPLALYTPRSFSALLIRQLHPVKAHCQVYKNGKITINGGNSVVQSQSLAQTFANQIRGCGFDAAINNYRVVNMIGSLDFERPLRLEEISVHLKADYCPELFPGLSVRLSYCTAVLFHSGKVNLLGAVSELHLLAAELELNILL